MKSEIHLQSEAVQCWKPGINSMSPSGSKAHQHHHHHHHQCHPINNISWCLLSRASNLSSLIPFYSPKTTQFPDTSTKPSCPPSKICAPLSLLLANSPLQLQLLSSSSFESTQSDSLSSGPPSSSSALKKGMSSNSRSGFPSAVRISSMNSSGKGGPAFMGQVFSMSDPSGTGVIAVSTHFDIPFISKRTPEWLKKIFAPVTKSESNHPVFRFFMDLRDAVTYVKRCNIPNGVVGAFHLDLAFEHFREKPHLFQFIPNEKQVKEANKLLKALPQDGRRKRVDGVPVFSAQNLDIAIATSDGIKWYTPYFFDKNMLDSILEESFDLHFHSLIRTRDLQRRRDFIDEDVWDPPEVDEVASEVMDEFPEEMMDAVPGLVFNSISEAAGIELLHAVDKVVLGNRWLRKATGIQPKFPYMVDSFEKRSTASMLRASKSSSLEDKTESKNCNDLQQCGTSVLASEDSIRAEEYMKYELRSSPFVPKITMVGISTGKAEHMSKANLKKTTIMEDITRELELAEQENTDVSIRDRDPLFVADMGERFHVYM